MSGSERQEWNRRHAERGFAPSEPSSVLLRRASGLPRRGRALDVAGGTGRHALWLAARGLDATLLDISDVALDLARQEANGRGLRLSTVAADLDQDPLPSGPWDVILFFHYIHRTLWAGLRAELAPDGTLIWIHPTVRNLERHPAPRRHHLFDEGELLSLATEAGFLVERYEEGWLEETRHDAVLVARSPGPASDP